MALLVLEMPAALGAQELSALVDPLLRRARQLEQARAEAARRPLLQASFKRPLKAGGLDDGHRRLRPRTASSRERMERRRMR